jgi:hypothetical protein
MNGGGLDRKKIMLKPISSLSSTLVYKKENFEYQDS